MIRFIHNYKAISGPVPSWVDYLIKVGEQWTRSKQTDTRHISIISMPCESDAAGLIALGGVISDLQNPNANDRQAHKSTLLKYAFQYLNHCRSCELAKCDPEVKLCGFDSKASGHLRSISQPRKKYLFSEKTDYSEKQLVVESRGQGRHGTIFEYPHSAIFDWYLEGDHPVHTETDDESLDEDLYREFCGPDTGPFEQENLRSSYSGLCLAAKPMGNQATKKSYSATGFEINGRRTMLSELLPIGRWRTVNNISRLTLFNPRTEKFDRPRTVQPGLVIADGARTLLKLIQGSEFQHADVIGVISRLEPREMLEDVYGELEL